MNKESEILQLSKLSREEITRLCNDNLYYDEICNSEEFFKDRTEYFYPNYIIFKKSEETWKTFFNAIDKLIFFSERIETDNNEEMKLEMLLKAIRDNNEIVLRIIQEEYPETKNLVFSDKFIAYCITHKNIEILKSLLTNISKEPLSPENQILLINTFPLEDIEQFDKYLTYPELLHHYNLNDLPTFQYLLSTKVSEGVLTNIEVQYLVNRAARNGNLFVLEFLVAAQALPSAKSFLMALCKGYLEVVLFLYERDPTYIVQIKNHLLFPYSHRISEILIFLQRACPTCLNSEMSDYICFYGSPHDLQWLIDNYDAYPSYMGVINAIQKENSKVIKWILDLNINFSDLEYSYITEAINRNLISSVNMLKYYYFRGFTFTSLAANIAAANLIFSGVEFLASLGVLPNVIGANQVIINCNEKNYEEIVKMANWLADHAILPNHDVYLEMSLEYKIRQWLERRGIVR